VTENTIEIYKGRKQLRQAWRWRAVAPNGRIVATGGEAYVNVGDVLSIVEKLFGKSAADKARAQLPT
jgi:uncharacterized protein YegP (UPF0339 family)